MQSFFEIVIIANFAQIVLTIGTHFFLANNGGIDVKREKSIIAIMYLILVYSLSNSITTFFVETGKSDMICTIFKMIGLIIRPIIPVFLLFSVLPKNKYNILLVAPALLNTIIYIMSIFVDNLCFKYENGVYIRANNITGYLCLIISIVYLVILMVTLLVLFAKDNIKETFVLILCFIFCMASGIIEFFKDVYVLGLVASISLIFYYLFLHVQYSKKDVATGLLNRQSYYTFIEQNNDKITSIIMLDMNDLKKINDSKGHSAGDEALKKVGESITKTITPKMKVFRHGGDEFIVVCINTTKGVVLETMENIKKNVASLGMSISAGYGYREYKEPAIELEKIADTRMYEDKAIYHMKKGNDRRVN